MHKKYVRAANILSNALKFTNRAYVKLTGRHQQIFVAFLENMNFKGLNCYNIIPHTSINLIAIPRQRTPQLPKPAPSDTPSLVNFDALIQEFTGGRAGPTGNFFLYLSN